MMASLGQLIHLGTVSKGQPPGRQKDSPACTLATHSRPAEVSTLTGLMGTEHSSNTRAWAEFSARRGHSRYAALPKCRSASAVAHQHIVQRKQPRAIDCTEQGRMALKPCPARCALVYKSAPCKYPGTRQIYINRFAGRHRHMDRD